MSYSIELQKRVIESYEAFRKNYIKYLREIKEIAKNIFRENFLELVVFGSTVKGNYKKWSDIDVAVILKGEVDEFQKAKLLSVVRKKYGLLHPFEIHVVTKDMWEKWYKKFVKGDYRKI